MSQQKMMQLPETVEVAGKLLFDAKQYIMDTPSPNAPVSVAIGIIGRLELALMDAAGVGADGKPKDPDGVMGDAKKRAAGGGG